jgi:hypothetical protein
MATGSHSDTLTTGVSDLRTIGTIAQLMAGAIKHHTLYPEDHSIARQHIGKIFDNICTFLKNHTTLHLEVGKNTMAYEGDVVYQGKPDENDIAFLLGRDGVEWLEFSRDLELWEIKSLLRLINDNRRSDMESDSTIATDLWEQDFPHIEYKTINLMAMDLPLLDLGSFQVAAGPETALDEQTDRPGRAASCQDYYSQESDEEDDGDIIEESSEEAAAIGLALTDPGSALWNLTEVEQFQLDAMVSKEENSVDFESTIEILLILLLVQNDRQEAIDILAFLQDRFLYCLQQHQFKYALKIISTLNKIATTQNKRQKQLSPLISELFLSMSRPESLRDLEKFFTEPEEPVQDSELDAFWTLIRFLPHDVLKTLAPLSCKIDIQRFGPAFLAIFEHYCEIDSRYLAAVAGEIDTKICLQLFPFIQRIRMDHAIPVLSAMAHHSSPLVRRRAFQLLVDWDAVDIQKLLPLIDDQDETIRGTILSLAGKQRNPTIERMLRKHLQEHAENTEDREHILACYHALGRSGSTQSIPFLKKCLFQGSKLGTLFATGGGAHKEGAARALMALRIPEAKKIVQEGTRNILPDVRAACRKALGTRHA